MALTFFLVVTSEKPSPRHPGGGFLLSPDDPRVGLRTGLSVQGSQQDVPKRYGGIPVRTIRRGDIDRGLTLTGIAAGQFRWTARFGSRLRAIYHRNQSECGGYSFIKDLVNRPT